MEADWAFEVGPGAPVIDAHWSGYIDLRAHPEEAAHLSEAAGLPALATALGKLNVQSSPVWSAKCDQWRVDPLENELDPIEIGAPPDAPPAAYTVAQACYIDLLSHPPSRWSRPQEAESFCKTLCERLRTIPLRLMRADFVIRRAVLAGGQESLGVTAYLVGCGASDEEARQVLARALAAFSDSVCAG